VSEALADPSLAKRVEVRNGQTRATDGPFPEMKELLAGIYLIQCESLDRAIGIAARVPEADLGLVEVRPVMDLTGSSCEVVEAELLAQHPKRRRPGLQCGPAIESCHRAIGESSYRGK
jgi:hypothetical protein